jgi:hypothetical protein
MTGLPSPSLSWRTELAVRMVDQVGWTFPASIRQTVEAGMPATADKVLMDTPFRLRIQANSAAASFMAQFSPTPSVCA